MRLLRIVSGSAVAMLVTVGALTQANTRTAEGTAGQPPVAARQVAAVLPQERDSGGADVALLTAELLARAHYARQPLNDAVSSKLLDRYLDALDPQRIYFLQSDLQEFEPLRTTLDDLISTQGDTSPARQIFARFAERLEANVAYVDAALKEGGFTFTADDTYFLDRKALPRPKDLAEARQLWAERLRYEYLQEKLNKKTPDEIAKDINRRYARLARSVREYDGDDIFELYLTSLAHVYDPHSDYLGKASSENFNIGLTLSLAGIGAVLEPEDGYAKVRELTPGGPASKSKKLKPGDRIVAVAQGSAGEPVDTVDMKLNKVVEMIRGPKGTTVRLTILPADAPDPSTRRTVVLVRDDIKLEDQAAKARLIELPQGAGKPMRLGVIDLPLFYRNEQKGTGATADVARLLKKLKQEKAAGVILDLRRNGGGSLPEAIALTGLFIKQGPVVQVRDPNGGVAVSKDTDPSVAYSGPLVVLISRQSASASEILAGALQDYRRALIVGESSSSFGKGTVQALIGLASMLRSKTGGDADPGSLKLTVQKFYRASGSSTQLKGVTPDIVLPSLNNVLDVGERSLDNPLPWDTIASATYQRENQISPTLVAQLKKSSDARVAADKDFTYLREEIARVAKTVESKSVSLNEERRTRERQEIEARAEARRKELAARPKPKERVFALSLANADKPGLPAPVAPPSPDAGAAKGPAARPAQKTGAEDPAGRVTDNQTPERDLTLDEAQRILRDLVSRSKPKTAQSRQPRG